MFISGIKHRDSVLHVCVCVCVCVCMYIYIYMYGSDDKESPCIEGDLGSIPGLGRSPGGGHGNPLQYSCLENTMSSMKSKEI